MRAALRWIAIGLVATAVTLSGCTQPADDSGTQVTPPTDDEGRYVVLVGEDGRFRFDPPVAQVPVNATVRWINADGYHNVEGDDGSFSSGEPSNAQWTFEWTFGASGEYGYHCKPHRGAGMTGTIVVGAAV